MLADDELEDDDVAEPLYTPETATPVEHADDVTPDQHAHEEASPDVVLPAAAASLKRKGKGHKKN